jgi:hypothetical protein
LVIHGARISRHPLPPENPGCGGFAGSLSPAVVLGARLRDNGGWFWNPNEATILTATRKKDAPFGAAEI